MNPISRGSYDYRLAARDRKLAKLETSLSLARCSNNKQEITRIEKEISKIRSSIY
jgi:hypothetical protein